MDKNRLAMTARGRLLLRTGGNYILISVALTQLEAFFGAALGAIPIQMNAQFTMAQLSAGSWLTALAILFGNIGLLAFAYFQTKNAYRRLNAYITNLPMTPGVQEELSAWSEITSLTWKYGLGAAFAAIFVIIAPLVVYQLFYLGTTSDQAVYALFGGIVTSIAIVILAMFTIDALCLPAREVLLPKNFDAQLSGAAGFRLNIKYLGIFPALILISILLIAPLGYHQTIQAINGVISSSQAKQELQVQSISISLMVLILGFGLSLVMSRSITNPINHLIDIFKKVEAGDLKQRARILATDETSEVAIYFNRMLSRLETLQQNLEQQVNARTSLLQATNDVGRIASSILEPDTLISQLVNLITERFGYYYAAIFLVDESGTWAELKDATGAAGQTLKAQRHRLQVGGKSMVGSAISTQNPRVAQNVGMEIYRFDNPLLPDTRSEIALPLTVGEHVLGALDVQSTNEAAFDEQTIETLRSMAGQVAIALENAHLFQETRQNLEEIRAIHQQYMTNVWSEKIRLSEMEYTAELPGVASAENRNKTINIPLTLRDQQLGQIVLETEGDWDPEDKAWAEAVATQVAISLENARLIEESQQAALRERLAAAITEKIWSSTSIDGILQAAVRELGRSLEASEALIELRFEEGKAK
jgi:GAF domain-containing protein/HAMP domain-containing protein